MACSAISRGVTSVRFSTLQCEDSPADMQWVFEQAKVPGQAEDFHSFRHVQVWGRFEVFCYYAKICKAIFFFLIPDQYFGILGYFRH